MNIGYIGLGKMGLNMVARLVESGHSVVATDKNPAALGEVTGLGALVAQSNVDLVNSLSGERLIWLMVPHAFVDEVLAEITPHLEVGDTVIDGGNSFHRDTIRRAQDLSTKGIAYLDAGVSGGPDGARNGACIMVGGAQEDYRRFEPLFRDLAAPDAYGYMGPVGSGHFVKMVHNGIEYGMMQAIAEGFAIMHKREPKLNLIEVARVYNHASVIESRLVGWLASAYKEYGENLQEVSGSIAHTGEGKWTVDTAHELDVANPVIQAAFDFRVDSANNPSYTGKVVSALRNQFGGHSIKGPNKE